jgi:hypothetical protein
MLCNLRTHGVEKAMKAVLSACICLVLTACAIPTTGVVPLPDGLYKIAHQGNGSWVRTETLKATAIQEADAYCRTDGRKVRVIDVKQIEAQPFGGWPEAEALFKCE